MARSKKNKKRRASNHPNPNQNKSQNWNKKPRKGKWQRFWIEDCPDTKINPERKYSLEVVITRVELTDDYTQKQAVIATSIQQSQLPESNSVAGDNDEKFPATDDIGTPNKYEATDEHQRNPGKIETSEAKVIGSNKNEISKDTDEKVCKSAAHLDQTSESATLENDATTTDGEVNKPETLKTDVNSKEGNAQEETANSQNSPSDIVSNSFVSIKRAESAKGKLQKFFDNDNFSPSANGDCGDGIKNPYPTSEVPDKFWSQRHRLFTLFDDGIQLDTESWFSVTPQAIADHIASRVASMEKKKLVVLDPFCGCGGNIIAFAKRDEVGLVVGVDTDIGKLRKAAANAQIYGIPTEKLLFIHDDACKVLSAYIDGKLVSLDEDATATLGASCATSVDCRIGGLDTLPAMIDAIFLSPPWGGVDYVKVGKRNYGLSCIKLSENVDGDQLLALASKALGTRPLVYFLPRNTNGSYLGQSFLRMGYEGNIEMEQNVLNGKLKTITVYAGLN